MGIRTGRQFLDSLRDDRQIWLDRRAGQRRRVPSAPWSGGPHARRTLRFAASRRPERADSPTPRPPPAIASGLTFIEPASESDLVRRRAAVKTWMDWCGGMMGRTPDFMNIHITGFGSAHEYFARGGKQFGRNIRAYYEFLRERDLCLTHTLLSPTVDKSKPVQNQPPGVAAAIVKETDAGIVVNGARSVATLAPFANEIAVFPSTYLQNSEEARPYAFAFCVPVATPGLRFICRPSLTEIAGPPGDHPFSSRMDEMDCVAIFDHVMVPWERVFVARDVALVNGLFVETGCMNQLMHQFAIKNLAKAEFLLGVALNMCDAVNSRADNVQNLLAEMINTVELVRAAIRAAEVDTCPGPGRHRAAQRRAAVDRAFAVPATLSAPGRNRADARVEQPGDDAVAGGVRGRARRRCRALLPGRRRFGRAACAALSPRVGRLVFVVRRPPDALRALLLGRPVAPWHGALPRLYAEGIAQTTRLGFHRARRQCPRRRDTKRD